MLFRAGAGMPSQPKSVRGQLLRGPEEPEPLRRQLVRGRQVPRLSRQSRQVPGLPVLQAPAPHQQDPKLPAEVTHVAECEHHRHFAYLLQARLRHAQKRSLPARAPAQLVPEPRASRARLGEHRHLDERGPPLAPPGGLALGRLLLQSQEPRRQVPAAASRQRSQLAAGEPQDALEAIEEGLRPRRRLLQ